MLEQATQHLALLTLVFPDSLSNVYPRTAPRPDKIPMPNDTAAHFLPTTPNTLSSFSHDTTLSIVVPFSEASSFLTKIRELPNEADSNKDSEGVEPRLIQSWVMEAAKKTGEDQRPVPSWTTSAWTKFVDLIKVIFQQETQQYLLTRCRTPNRWISS